MSNDRSPRDVCSITIGINGLIQVPPLASGGPQFRVGLGLFLVGCPDCLTCCRLLRRDALDLGRDAIERTGEPHRLALRGVRAGLASLLDDLVAFLEALAEGLVDLLVRHVDAELVRSRLE